MTPNLITLAFPDTGTTQTVTTAADLYRAMMPRRGRPAIVTIHRWSGTLTPDGVGLDWALGGVGAPIVIDGSGAGLIDTGTDKLIGTWADPARPLGNVVFRGLKARPTRRTTEPTVGIALTGGWTNVLFEGCDISRYRMNVTVEGDLTNWATGVRFSRCLLADSFHIGTDADSSGLLLKHTSGTIVEDNVLDHNGWSETIAGAGPTIRCHNFYCNMPENSGTIIRRNIVSRGGASGLRSCGAACYENILLANPVGIIAAPGCELVADNVILDSRDIGPANPIGVGIEVGTGGVKIARNVIAGRSTPATWNVKGIHIHDAPGLVDLDSNVIDGWGTENTESTAIGWEATAAKLAMRNNRARMPAGTRLAWGYGAGKITAGGNQWCGGSGQPFNTGEYNPRTLTGWQGMTNAQGDSAVPFPSVPGLRDYCATLGWDEPAYYAAARARDPRAWGLLRFVQDAAGVGA